MVKVLITGAGSYIGCKVAEYLSRDEAEFSVDTIGTREGAWRTADFNKYDVVFHVAGLAHIKATRKLKPLYYQINRDLAIEVAKRAKSAGVRQFIFMSSMSAFHGSCSLKTEVITPTTESHPNNYYGDSKLQAENAIKALEQDSFRVCILRPPMVYGANAKGNFLRLVRLAMRAPLFPALHNKRSMIYIDNLSEFVKQAILRRMSGTFYPQNKELADTVEIVKYFARKHNHRIWISPIFNPLVGLLCPFIPAFSRMFGSYYYDPLLSQTDFDYQIVSQSESFEMMA